MQLRLAIKGIFVARPFRQEVSRLFTFLLYGLFGIGKTPSYIVRVQPKFMAVSGCALQWIAIGVLAVELILWGSLSEPARLSVSLFGIVSFLAGLFLAIRAGSFGPIVVIPGLVGIIILFFIAVILHPIRFFLPKD